MATNVAIPAAAAPVIGVNSAAINLANLAALGLAPAAYGIEPVVGLAPAAFGVGPAVKIGAGLPVINVPGYGPIAI